MYYIIIIRQFCDCVVHCLRGDEEPKWLIQSLCGPVPIHYVEYKLEKGLMCRTERIHVIRGPSWRMSSRHPVLGLGLGSRVLWIFAIWSGLGTGRILKPYAFLFALSLANDICRGTTAHARQQWPPLPQYVVMSSGLSSHLHTCVQSRYFIHVYTPLHTI